MVAAGVAAGMAAAFGAPLGGALYALEEASGAWSRRAAWRCLLCAATAAFTMRQLAPRDAGVLSLAGYSGLAPRQWLYQVPLIAAVAAGAALLGCLLNLLRARVLRARAPRRARAARLLQAAAVAAATVAAFALVPAAAGRCLPLPREWDAAAPVRGACGEGEYSDAASLLLGGSPWAIRALLGLGSEAEPLSFACTLAAPCYFGVSALAAVCGCYLLLAALASGLTAVPGGLFMPAILTGASFGAAAGQLLAASLGAVWDVQPGVYAVVGAVAALSAVMRTGASVALTVVFVEGTGGVDLLAGITGAIIVSNIVAAWAAPEGLYERELGTDGGVHYLRHDPPHALRGRCATDLAASPARCLPPLAGVAAARAALWETTHNGFPVVAAPGGRVLGLVLRSQLEALLRARAFCDAGGQYLSPPHDAAAYEATLHAEMRDASAAAAGLGAPRAARRAGAGGAAEPLLAPPLQLEAGGAAEAEAGAFLDLAPWMDRAPISVRPETPAPRAHQLFLALSLRHLLVLDAGGAALGVITRKDLDAAAGAGWWRSAAPAPAPRRSPVAPGGASPRGWRAFAPPARALSDLIAKMSPRPGSSFASGAYFSAAASSNGDASVGGASP
jgi:chloride channel 7